MSATSLQQSLLFPHMLVSYQGVISHSSDEGVQAWNMSFVVYLADLPANLDKRNPGSLGFFFLF